jgi:hypothetical protein
MIGGALARPCISYPELFARSTIWDRFPYLLPNLFSAITVFVGVIIGILFLEETHAQKKHQRDRGLELGNYLVSFVCRFGKCRYRERTPEKQGLLDGEHSGYYQEHGVGDGCSDTAANNASDSEEALPAYRSQDSSPKLLPQPDSQPAEVASSPAPESKIFTKPVIMNIVSYGILAL